MDEKVKSILMGHFAEEIEKLTAECNRELSHDGYPENGRATVVIFRRYIRFELSYHITVTVSHESGRVVSNTLSAAYLKPEKVNCDAQFYENRMRNKAVYSAICTAGKEEKIEKLLSDAEAGLLLKRGDGGKFEKVVV